MLFTKIEEIVAWKRGCRLAVNIYKITAKGALEKDWGLRDQMRRAAVSISSNIAEGYERDTAPEFKRFASIAKGSCGELRTQLYIAQALDYITKSDAESLLQECMEISSMIAGLKKSFKTPNKKLSKPNKE